MRASVRSDATPGLCFQTVRQGISGAKQSFYNPLACYPVFVAFSLNQRMMNNPTTKNRGRLMAAPQSVKEVSADTSLIKQEREFLPVWRRFACLTAGRNSRKCFV